MWIASGVAHILVPNQEGANLGSVSFYSGNHRRGIGTPDPQFPHRGKDDNASTEREFSGTELLKDLWKYRDFWEINREKNRIT